MQVDVFNQQGKKVADVSLNEAIFGRPSNAPLVAQAIRVRLTNARLGNAHTQTRAEVRGGGRKPWRQKGTGRARHGSTRSPIWIGGGVALGPRSRTLHLDLPTQMRRAALFSSLSDKVRSEQVLILDALTLSEVKTSKLQEVMTALPVGRTTLLVTASKDEAIIRAARNLGDIKVVMASVLHPYEILKYQTVVFLKDSLATLEETFLNGDKVASQQDSKEASKANVELEKPVAKKAAATKTSEKPASTAKSTAAKKPAVKKAAAKKEEKA